VTERVRFTVRFSGLELTYGRTRVAGSLDGALDSGRVWAITGPNGSGKTTLVRTLIGLQRARRGSVEGVTGRTVSYVPQLGSMDDTVPVTVAEVVSTGGRSRMRRGDRRAAIHESLVRVGMERFARRPFFKLSGGQRQRVLVARALFADAEMVVLDEPTTGVDAAAADGIWELIRDTAEADRLVVVVTHDLYRAPSYAHRTLVLDAAGLREASGV